MPTPAWLWMALGAAGTALLGLGGWLVVRRRPAPLEEEPAEPLAPAVSAPPAVAVKPPPGLAVPTAPIARANEPFELRLEPTRISYAASEVVIEFDLLIANTSGAGAENIRLGFAAISASARQDDAIAAFHGGPPIDASGPAFVLAPGAGGRMPVRIAIPAQGIHAVQVGGRPMFVPIVLVDLRWRAGLGIRRFGADFMIGTAGQGDKLGPLWLDRPAPSGRLAAHRYFAKELAAA